MGDRQGRLSAVTLGPFVGVDFKLWPTVADTLVSRVLREPVVSATEPRKNPTTHTHYHMGKRRSVLMFAFLTNSDDVLKIFTMEVYVEVSTVENWLFRPLSCMLKEYSVNYLKNFKFKLHMWPVSGESLHRTVIVGAKRDVIYSICALSIRIDTRSTNSTEYLKFSHYFVPQMTITHSQRV